VIPHSEVSADRQSHVMSSHSFKSHLSSIALECVGRGSHVYTCNLGALKSYLFHFSTPHNEIFVNALNCIIYAPTNIARHPLQSPSNYRALYQPTEPATPSMNNTSFKQCDSNRMFWRLHLRQPRILTTSLIYPRNSSQKIKTAASKGTENRTLSIRKRIGPFFN
jgi:hypothetical protein